MDHSDLVRAWKDPDSDFPSTVPNPAGEIDLSQAHAGTQQEVRTEYIASLGCCQGLTTAPAWPCVPTWHTGPYIPCLPQET